MMHKSHSNDAAPWSSMPGWGIVVDLTPPELHERRTLVVLQRVIAAALVLVVVICIGGYVLASRSVNSAQRTLDTTTAGTAAIQTDLNRHSGVTRVRSATAAIDSQLATLFATDVDVSKLVRDLTQALPVGMVISSVNLSVSATSEASVDPSTGTAGTVTLTGTSRTLDDLAHYVTALNGLKGVTAVVPTTNSASGTTVSWTLSLQLTAARNTARFGVAGPVAAATTPGVTTNGTPATDTTTGGS